MERIQARPRCGLRLVADEEMAFAVRKDFDSAGAKGVKIVSVNGTDAALAAVKDGRFSATVSHWANDTGNRPSGTPSPCSEARKESIDKIVGAPVRPVTKDNADTAPVYCATD